MGSILMQDAFFSAVTEGRVDPAFHPSGVGEMDTVYSHRGNVVVNHQECALGSKSSRCLSCKSSSQVKVQIKVQEEVKVR